MCMYFNFTEKSKLAIRLLLNVTLLQNSVHFLLAHKLLHFLKSYEEQFNEKTYVQNIVPSSCLQIRGAMEHIYYVVDHTNKVPTQ